MKIGKELAELDMCSIGSDGVSYRERAQGKISVSIVVGGERYGAQPIPLKKALI